MAKKQTPAAGADENKSPVSLTNNIQGTDLKPSIDTFFRLLEEKFGDSFRLNAMTGKPELLDPVQDKWCEWTDVHDAKMRLWFQKEYGLYHEKMLRDALQVFLSYHQVNPLTDLLNSLVWDGKPRIQSFLHDILSCDDTPYIREVSRLIFAGGIHRALEPGCKFDDMVVLVGKQGCGKSTTVRWLNMNDDWYRELKVIGGREAVEAMNGAWIIDMTELMAMTRVREAEAIKAFITAQEDTYRAPYDRHSQTRLRGCIFIGTTNNPLFLSDRTGNRRFYPVQCRSDGYEIRAHEKEIRAQIVQCWAEAVALYKQGKLSPYADRAVIDLIRKEQENAMEDDWRVGAITDYLDQTKKDPKATVSIIELWHCALNEPDEVKPCRKDSIEIAQIMNGIPGWKRTDTILTTRWGKQKVYRKEEPYYPF
ncbi:MAG: hypothetical protein IJI08_04545 [Clostridia bacterium]|nr:hypothetical protein [Clostridia bacterium]